MAVARALLFLWRRRLVAPAAPYSAAAAGGGSWGLLSRFRRKKDDLDTVVVSGQLELAPSHLASSEFEKPPPRSRRYSPPDDVEKRVEFHLRQVLGVSLPKDWKEVPLEDRGQKFSILSGLSRELQHSIPNSRLHFMKCAGDILDFYQTPVQDTSKFDDLASLELPPNLRIRWGYE